MEPIKPYLIRAFYDWIADNGNTPYIIVNAELERVIVPRQYVSGGQIVLNISIDAVDELELSNQAISFSARFAGIAKQVYIPTQAVIAIYTKENGRGIVFAEDEKEGSAHGNFMHSTSDFEFLEDTEVDAIDEPQYESASSVENNEVHQSKNATSKKGKNSKNDKNSKNSKNSKYGHLTVIK